MDEAMMVRTMLLFSVHLLRSFRVHEALAPRVCLPRVQRARCWNADTNQRGTQHEDSGPGSSPDPIKAANPTRKYVAELERKAYLDAYREALDAWQEGDHAVIFPFGSWKVVRHHAAVVAIPPPDFRR